MAQLFKNVNVTKATCKISCYCDQGEITVMYPVMYPVHQIACPYCGNVLHIEWIFQVATHIEIPSEEFLQIQNERIQEWNEKHGRPYVQ